MNKVIPFVLGAAAGSLVTGLAVKQYYKHIADEEIESVVQRFKDRTKSDGEIVHSAGLCVVEPKIESDTDTESYTIQQEEYKKLLEDNGYSAIPGDDNYAVFDDYSDDENMKPFVIAPEDFGELGYDTKSWKFYKDFVLTDEEGEVVLDPENIIGDALSHFGAYEDDVVHVRNMDVECDYEIFKDERTFSEICGGSVDDDAE